MIKYYKKIISFSVLVSIAIIFVIVTPESGNSRSKTSIRSKTNIKADISGEELQAVVVEDFEKGAILNPDGAIVKNFAKAGWIVMSTPKKYESAETEKKLKLKSPIEKLQMKFIEGRPNAMALEQWSLTGLGLKKDSNKYQCLGVNFKFRYPGYNSVHIIVPKEVQWKSHKPVLTYNPITRKSEQERGIQLPGRAKAISLWIHGRGNPYNLEIWLKDYRGETHILKVGDVNFIGWKPLKVDIPGNVPQSYESYPQTRVTKIIRFVLRAQINRPKEELIGNTYFFFDQLKVLTDTYEVNFDGNDMHKVFEK